MLYGRNQKAGFFIDFFTTRVVREPFLPTGHGTVERNPCCTDDVFTLIEGVDKVEPNAKVCRRSRRPIALFFVFLQMFGFPECAVSIIVFREVNIF